MSHFESPHMGKQGPLWKIPELSFKQSTWITWNIKMISYIPLRAKKMFIVVVTMSQNSLTPTSTCVTISDWSEAWRNNMAEKTIMKQAIFYKFSLGWLMLRLKVAVIGLEPGTTAWPRSVGRPPRLFPHHWGPRLGAEVGSLLHSNLLGFGWESLQPTVLTISPCSYYTSGERVRGRARERKRDRKGEEGISEANMWSGNRPGVLSHWTADVWWVGTRCQVITSGYKAEQREHQSWLWQKKTCWRFLFTLLISQPLGVNNSMCLRNLITSLHFHKPASWDVIFDIVFFFYYNWYCY